VDGLCADELAEVAGAALWVQDEEARSVKSGGRKGKGARRR